MSDLTPAAHAVLARQHGVASKTDLLDAGMTVRRIRDVVRRGGLMLVLSGAYRSPSVPDGELQRCAAVCRAHPELVVGGPTAGRLHGFRRLPRDRRVHVIGPPHSNPTLTPWVKVFRTPTLRAVDIVRRPDGIAVLDRPRLTLDLARFLDRGDLTSVIEQALHDGGHTVADLQAAALDWLSPRRGWVTRFLEVLEHRLDGPAAESHLEVIVGERLVDAGVRGLVRQHTERLPGYGTVRFDLAVPAVRWALEVDGFPTHRELAGAVSDDRRDQAARAAGWVVRRIGPDDFGARLDATVRALAAELDRRRRHAS